MAITVEWKKLGEVGKFTRGKGLQKADITIDGNVPIILYGELYTTYGDYITEIKSFTNMANIHSEVVIEKDDLLLPLSSTTKDACIGKVSVYATDKKCYLGGDALILRHNQCAAFLMYLLNSKYFEVKKMACVKGTTIQHLSVEGLKNILIPIPPISEQERVVAILDKFTELERELERERALRVKQYEWYRDRLLTFEGGGLEYRKLGEVCEIYTGGEAPKGCIKGQEATKECCYPVYSNGVDIYGYAPTYRINKDAVTISSIGNVGYAAYRKAFFTPIIRLKVAIPKDDTLIAKYLYYALTNIKINSKNSTVPNMNANEIKRILIPLPPLSEQERIVATLDKFSALCNDIMAGLPAEIAARKKQYEYYRDRLLTFE